MHLSIKILVCIPALKVIHKNVLKFWGDIAFILLFLYRLYSF